MVTKEERKQVSHTPMPWRPTEDAQGICGLMHPTKKGVAVAWFSDCHEPLKGFVGDQDDDEPKLGRPERQANAYLIMAAPEMLEALRTVSKNIEDLGNDEETPCTSEMFELLVSWQSKIGLVIAKAEGRKA